MKKIALALLLSMSAIFSAHADVVNPTVEIALVKSVGTTDQWSAGFGNTINKGSDAWFTDTYIFTPEMAGKFKVNGGVFNIYSSMAQSVAFDWVTLNDVKLTLKHSYDADMGQGFYSAALGNTWMTGPLKLVVHGFAGGEAPAFSASYVGTLNVRGIAAVPEPETYAMLVAGLGLVGLMARRRKQSV
ncbi:FxDxF family PEP-CTERM protein [Pseudoduganella danionis]|jgi:hypothetical protein|uniref:FxDxF family PEP-CTERM protein n=1 Tax=Pseudoduganella danionis TaxID=1890295 RepID=UPI0035B47CA9